MKKIISIILSLTIVGAFSGCSAENDKVSPSMNETTTTTATATTTTTGTTTDSAPATTTTVSTITTKTSVTEAMTREETVGKVEESTAKKLELPSKTMLEITNISQYPELPTGSSIVSAIIALNYNGFDCSKTDFLQYVNMQNNPGSAYWESPEEVYFGNPEIYHISYGSSSVINDSINSFLESNNITGYEVVDLNGSDFSDLFFEINNQNPVIIWVSILMEDYDFEGFHLQNGDTFMYNPYNECVCLVGFDNEKGTVYVCDPQSEENVLEYPKSVVENVYNKMGKQALVIHKK